MSKFKNVEYYLSSFENMLNEKGMGKYKKIETYFKEIKTEVLKCIYEPSKEDRWENFLELVTLDEKLTLLNDSLVYIEYYKMTDIEIIEMVEKDYENFRKEFFGHPLNPVPFSLIFPSDFRA